MGWTCSHKPSNVSIKEFFTKEFSDAEHGCEVLDVAVVGFREAYIAIKRMIFDVEIIYCTVAKLAYEKDNYFNFSYKEMSEFSHPYYYNCPERILNLLTDFDDALLNKMYPKAEPSELLTWRKKCREMLTKKAMLKSLENGMVIELEQPASFGRTNTWSAKRFKVYDKRRNVYETSCGLVRLPKNYLATHNWSLVIPDVVVS